MTIDLTLAKLTRKLGKRPPEPERFPRRQLYTAMQKRGDQRLSTTRTLVGKEGPEQGTLQLLEMFESKELAYVITMHDWGLFNAVHPYELFYQVFGRHKFNRITANLDMFMRRFNEMQYWVCTELCLCENIGKRVILLRKFIKLVSSFTLINLETIFILL